MPKWRQLAASGASALVIATALAGWFEGRELHAYVDVGGVPTICYGHTGGVQPGDIATPAECEWLLTQDMRRARDGVLACVNRAMSNAQLAAFADLAYNIGTTRFCRSSVARRFNAGDIRVACAAIKLYDMADGHVMPGLVDRRSAEYELCMRGVS